jgi:hypothetical protein
MNQRIFNRIIEAARALKPRVQSGKSHHVSALVYKSKIVCLATNDYRKMHNEKKFGKYQNWKGFNGEYRPCIHSEIKIITKWGEEDLSDHEFVNVRIDNKGNPNIARACPNCARVLFGFSPKRVFYSDENGQLQQDERF